jgi:ABC-type transporter Mla subunit MlaD
MTKQVKKFQEDYDKLNSLSAKLQSVNANDVSQIVQNLPEYINEFKDADKAYKSMMEELENMQKLVNENVT